MFRMAHDPKTKQYVARHVAAGRSTKEILLMLKRAIAREIRRLLTHKVSLPEYADRPARQAKNITVTAAARAFNIWPPSSPASNSANDAMTNSQIATEHGSRPLDNP
jgi:transposase